MLFVHALIAPDAGHDRHYSDKVLNFCEWYEFLVLLLRDFYRLDVEDDRPN
jgi:hypothetical protein